MWKWLTHPNIVPFLGVASPVMFPLCLVSLWMENGNILEYVKRHPRVNPFKLVSQQISDVHKAFIDSFHYRRQMLLAV